MWRTIDKGQRYEKVRCVSSTSSKQRILRNWDFIGGVTEYCYRTLGKKVLGFDIDCKMTILDIMQSISEIS